MSTGLLGAARDLGLAEGLGEVLEGLGSGLAADLRAGLGSVLEADLEAGLALGCNCFFCGGLLCTLGFEDVLNFFLGLTLINTVKRVGANTFRQSLKPFSKT